MTTIYYASITNDPSFLNNVDNSGTSSTAADVFEFRMGNGTYAPDRAECIKALEVFRRWIIQGGLSGAGANLPLPTGSA